LHLLTSAEKDDDSIETQRLLRENETLKEEIGNLTFKTEELQIELDLLKQVGVLFDLSDIQILICKGNRLEKFFLLYLVCGTC